MDTNNRWPPAPGRVHSRLRLKLTLSVTTAMYAKRRLCHSMFMFRQCLWTAVLFIYFILPTSLEWFCFTFSHSLHYVKWLVIIKTSISFELFPYATSWSIFNILYRTCQNFQIVVILHTSKRVIESFASECIIIYFCKLVYRSFINCVSLKSWFSNQCSVFYFFSSVSKKNILLFFCIKTECLFILILTVKYFFVLLLSKPLVWRARRCGSLSLNWVLKF